MLAYRKKELHKERAAKAAKFAASGCDRMTSNPAQTVLPSTKASVHDRAHCNLDSGFRSLLKLSSIITGSTSTLPKKAVSASDSELLTDAEIESRAERDVDRELQLYISDPVIHDHLSGADILRFWQVSGLHR
jgi:hypothetical protein